jgi:Protein of unknown function (DUF2490)
MIRSAALALPIALLMSTPAWARSDDQLWTTAGVNVKLSDDWKISEEIVTRFSDNRNGLYELEATTMLGYRLANGVTLAAGYVHNPQYSGGDFTVMEHRAREQLSFDNFTKLGPGKLSARMRLEQRWREGIDGTGWRARPYLKYSIPLAGKTNLNLSNETFVNFNTTAFQKQSGIDRMRNLISISTPLTKTLSGEAGYLNQYGFVRGGEDNVDHVAYFAVTLNL